MYSESYDTRGLNRTILAGLIHIRRFRTHQGRTEGSARAPAQLRIFLLIELVFQGYLKKFL